MNFIENIESEQFDEFVRNHQTKSHLLQSSTWAEVQKVKGSIPHLVGLEENGNLIATAMILERKFILGYNTFYIPRGFVLDYTNKELIKTFTKYIKAYAKKKRAIFIKIDPDIELHKIDSKAERIDSDVDNHHLVEYLESLGYKHLGFNRNFERTQPRFTFRIDLTKTFEELEASFDKAVKKRYRKALKYDIETIVGSQKNIKDFFNIMEITESQRGLVASDYDYYEKFYEIMNKKEKANVFLCKVFPERVINNIKAEIEDIEIELEKANDKQKKKLEEEKKILLNDLDKFLKYEGMHPDGLIVTAYVIAYFGNKAWSLYGGGNHPDLMDAFGNYKTYIDNLRYAKEHGVEIFDQFGTTGDLRSDNPLMGIHEYKKKFGGEYMEFIGEFDLVINRFPYFLYSKVLPKYRNFKKKFLRRK